METRIERNRQKERRVCGWEWEMWHRLSPGQSLKLDLKFWNKEVWYIHVCTESWELHSPQTSLFLCWTKIAAGIEINSNSSSDCAIYSRAQKCLLPTPLPASQTHHFTKTVTIQSRLAQWGEKILQPLGVLSLICSLPHHFCPHCIPCCLACVFWGTTELDVAVGARSAAGGDFLQTSCQTSLPKVPPNLNGLKGRSVPWSENGNR